MESIETSFCLPQYKYIYNYMSKNTPKGFEIKTDKMQNITVYNPSSHRESNNLVLFNVNMPYMVVTDIKDDKSAEFELVVYKDVISNQFVYKNGECIGIIRSKKDDSSKQYIEIISDNDVKIGDILTVETLKTQKGEILYTDSIYSDFLEYYIGYLNGFESNCVKLNNFTVCFSETTTLNYLNKQRFDNIIFIDLVKADENTSDFKFDGGSGLIMKNGGYVMRNAFYDKIKDLFKGEAGYGLCFCKESTLAEKAEILFGTPVYSIGVPIKFKDCGLSEISQRDISSAAKLTVEILNRI